MSGVVCPILSICQGIWNTDEIFVAMLKESTVNYNINKITINVLMSIII